MARYVVGAVEVAVNPVTAAQVAPPGALSPADAAKKEALKEAQRNGGGGIDGKVLLLGAAVVGLGIWATIKKKPKAKSSAGHVIAGR